LWQSKQEALGGSVKRSVAMAFSGCGTTIAKAYGLDAATRPDYHLFVVHPGLSGRRVQRWSLRRAELRAGVDCRRTP